MLSSVGPRLISDPAADLKRSGAAGFLCVTSSTNYALTSLETRESKFASFLRCFQSARLS